MNRFVIIAASTLALIACGKKESTESRGGGPTPVRSAMEACRRFESIGAASNCREESIEPALTPGAQQRVVFTLPSGKKGQVLSFNDKGDYEKSAENFEELSGAGKHRWGSKSSGIYVQLNKEADDDEARMIKDAVDAF